MTGDILPIGMAEMNRIFEVVDALEISRESIQVELLPGGEGSIELQTSGKVRIVLPETVGLEEWISTLERHLAGLAPTLERSR